MTHYSEAFKESIIQKMMPSNKVLIFQLVCDTGISNVTVHIWRKKVVSSGMPVPGDEKNSDQGTPENKFAVIIEVAALNETAMTEYCCTKACLLNTSDSGKRFLLTTFLHNLIAQAILKTELVSRKPAMPLVFQKEPSNAG